MSDWEDCESDSSEHKTIINKRPVCAQSSSSNTGTSSSGSGSDDYDSEYSSSYSYIEERSDTHESQKDIVYWCK